MMIFLLALSMMVATTASAIILLLAETEAKRQRAQPTAFSLSSMRNLRS
ncbi:hypothetical protein ACFOLL_03150 [Falsochrobactrum ovis]|uniref:Uncharacterized protein n=1 Tax=Falsochrobactrum ovis TaxID=1293442 RepID=A0A364JY62_9HYPH|nr:hypothetical protein [Falsochrobactrum ovis]RAK32396.1 hypothetical protein C7374_102402 [Falsochrobactrum ovis]